MFVEVDVYLRNKKNAIKIFALSRTVPCCFNSPCANVHYLVLYRLVCNLIFHTYVKDSLLLIPRLYQADVRKEINSESLWFSRWRTGTSVWSCSITFWTSSKYLFFEFCFFEIKYLFINK